MLTTSPERKTAVGNVPVNNLAPATTLIAAPGKGKRIRLHALHASNQDASGNPVGIIRWEGGSAWAIFPLGHNAQRRVSIELGKRYVLGPENTALELANEDGTVGAGDFQVQADYTVELG